MINRLGYKYFCVCQKVKISKLRNNDDDDLLEEDG